ncbi:MAG: hypothetical protein PSX80_07140 [bacterium]|nr:hypothetical protein [bacterium]
MVSSLCKIEPGLTITFIAGKLFADGVGAVAEACPINFFAERVVVVAGDDRADTVRVYPGRAEMIVGCIDRLRVASGLDDG